MERIAIGIDFRLRTHKLRLISNAINSPVLTPKSTHTTSKSLHKDTLFENWPLQLRSSWCFGGAPTFIFHFISKHHSDDSILVISSDAQVMKEQSHKSCAWAPRKRGNFLRNWGTLWLRAIKSSWQPRGWGDDWKPPTPALDLWKGFYLCFSCYSLSLPPHPPRRQENKTWSLGFSSVGVNPTHKTLQGKN